jgi:hypothetical protein
LNLSAPLCHEAARTGFAAWPFGFERVMVALRWLHDACGDRLIDGIRAASRTKTSANAGR